MNAIIVGHNGRPSMLSLITKYPFDKEVILFLQHTGTGELRRYSSKTGRKYDVIDRLPVFTKGDKVIRWGSRVHITSNGAMVYNKASNMKNATNKRMAREIFLEKGINAPKYITLDNLHETAYPIVLRNETHRGGKEFYVSNNDVETFDIISKLGNGYYMSEVYPKTAEYRVHCAHGKVLLIKRKPEPEDKSVVAWNWCQNKLPWSVVNRKDYDFDMCKLALKAIDAVGIDFGAVDMMSYPTDKNLPKHVVAEINTAPSHTPYLRKKYGAYFNLLFNTKGRMKFWEYNKYTKPESFVWKNFQLKIK